LKVIPETCHAHLTKFDLYVFINMTFILWKRKTLDHSSSVVVFIQIMSASRYNTFQFHNKII
jgi:hypothetical protein